MLFLWSPPTPALIGVDWNAPQSGNLQRESAFTLSFLITTAVPMCWSVHFHSSLFTFDPANDLQWHPALCSYTWNRIQQPAGLGPTYCSQSDAASHCGSTGTRTEGLTGLGFSTSTKHTPSNILQRIKRQLKVHHHFVPFWIFHQ